MNENQEKRKTMKRAKKPEKQKRKFYEHSALQLALDQARQTGKVREAAREHNVPYSTVQRYLRKPPKSNKSGPNTVLLPEEEAKIEEWILYMSRAGFPISESDLTHTVAEYANKIRKTRELPESFPSKNWSYHYLKRHPNINKKFITRLPKAGAKVTKDQIVGWFLEVEENLSDINVDLSIFNDPKRIYNFDESRFQLVPARFKALCDASASNVYYVNNNCYKESFTVLFGSSADGELTPPMIIYPGKRVTREIAENVPAGWSVGVSDEGWQTCKTFYEYMVNDVYRWLVVNKIEFPVIVFIDGHKSHVSIELTEFCTEKRIILVSLFPNSTRFLQPLDKDFFGPLKKIWFKVLREFFGNRSDARINKTNFGKLMKTAVESFSNSKECLRKGFKVCGICPWNMNEIDFSTLPSNVSEAESGSGDIDKTPAVTNANSNLIGQEKTVDFYQQQLTYIETGLDQEILSRFTDNYIKDFWYGPLEELALFNFWKIIKDKSQGLMFTEPLNQYGSIAMNFTLDESGNLTPTKIMNEESALANESNREPVRNDESANESIQEEEVRSNVQSSDPFDDVLIWPRVEDKRVDRKRRIQEHVPCVATSTRWLEWYNKKDRAKQEQEKAKVARIEQRKLQKQKKEEESRLKKMAREEKKNVKAKPKTTKKSKK